MSDINSSNEEFMSSLVEAVEDRFKEAGFYLVHAMVQGGLNPMFADGEQEEFSVKEAVINETGEFYLQVVFDINKIAWSDKVVRPEKAETDAMFEDMMPDITDPDVLKSTILSLFEKEDDSDT